MISKIYNLCIHIIVCSYDTVAYLYSTVVDVENGLAKAKIPSADR